MLRFIASIAVIALSSLAIAQPLSTAFTFQGELANGATPATGLVQGMVEKSNVQPVLEMGRMIEVTRAYTSLANLMSRTDELRRTAINKLADVPAS